MDLDRFASRLTAQLPQYFSWRPDPSALATDALLQDWEGLRAYANPPWNLLGRALAKVQREQVEVVLMIAPVWPTQPWYPSLLGLLIDYPRLIPQGENTLWGTPQSPVPAVVPRLAVWPISSRDIAQRAFQQELENCSWCHGGQNQPSLTILCSRNGLASWCEKRHTDPVSGPVSEVANFLADLFEKGYQQHSINAYRSAIASAHDRVDGVSVGQHPTVTHLMAGVANLRPPTAEVLVNMGREQGPRPYYKEGSKQGFEFEGPYPKDNHVVGPHYIGHPGQQTCIV